MSHLCQEMTMLNQERTRRTSPGKRLPPSGTVVVQALLIGLLVYPRPILRLVGQYDFFPAYIAWLAAAMFIPIAGRYKSYYVPATAVVWLLRWVGVVVFLVVTFRVQSVGIGDLFSLFGATGPTFFYEIGCLSVMKDNYWAFLKILLVALLLSAAPVAVVAAGILIKGGFSELLRSTATLRSLNSFWPNHVGILMAICFFVAQEISLSQPRYRILVISSVMILGLTLSRSGVLALMIGLLASRLLRGGLSWKDVRLVVISFVIVSGVFFAKAVLPQDSVQHTLNGRFDRWLASSAIWLKYPLFGLGFRSLTKAMPVFHHSSSGRFVNFGSAHNDYVDLLVRGGLVYFIGFLSFVTLHLAQCMQKNKCRSEGVVRIALATSTAILASALVQQPFKSPTVSVLLWFFAGTVACCRYPNKRENG